ncbi:hypothetical protein VTN31DRAFT_4515 [Thermomyces dupontii]|uniref:uncharacterized protein n=1 Tax=Talaromyces thermophilus TaxID=28565 RepID=UPI003743F31A
MPPTDDSVPYISPYPRPSPPSSRLLSSSPSSMVVECSDTEDEERMVSKKQEIAAPATATSTMNKQHPNDVSSLHQQESRIPRRRRTYQSYLQDMDEPPLEFPSLPYTAPTRLFPPQVPRPRIRRPTAASRTVLSAQGEHATETTVAKITIPTSPLVEQPEQRVHYYSNASREDVVEKESACHSDSTSPASFTDWHDVARDFEFDAEALFIDEDEVSLDEALVECRPRTQLQQKPRRKGMLGCVSGWFSAKK